VSDDANKKWFDAGELFRDGYPEGFTSAMRELPQISTKVIEELRAVGAQTILEIGPGDAPATSGMSGVTYLDVTEGFLRKLPGPCVLGDIRDLPFRDGAFELVVVNDVITHVPPPDRERTLDELCRVAETIFVFNPERGTRDVGGSPVDTPWVINGLSARGRGKVHWRRFVAWTGDGEYGMAIIVARRS
jgi:hypothetical protein